MKARLVQSPPKAGDWVYEIKLDGFRALARKANREARLLSRNGKDLGGKFPGVTDSISGLGIRSGILDGEIVALDKKGRSSFQRLQAFESGEERPPIFYYAFDLLHLDGKDLCKLPLVERKAKLENLLANQSGAIRYSASLGEDAERLLQHARRLGIEGLIGKQKAHIISPAGEAGPGSSSSCTGNRNSSWVGIRIPSERGSISGHFFSATMTIRRCVSRAR